MTDPYLHVLMHKHLSLERMKQAERERLVEMINEPPIHFQSLRELRHQISNWWTRRHQLTRETRIVEGKVVMP